MRKVLPVVFLIISAAAAWSESSLEEYQRDLTYIQSLYPRLEASSSSADLLDYISKMFQSLEIS